MAVRDDRGDVKQTTTGFRGPLMVQSLTSAKSKFLSLDTQCRRTVRHGWRNKEYETRRISQSYSQRVFIVRSLSRWKSH